MDPLLITLRLLHILSGVVWTGFAAFTSFYLVPSLADAGPDAGKIMASLQRRGLLTLLPALALITILSGLWLMQRVSGGSPAWFASPTAHVLSLGALFAFIAFLLGITVARPAMMRVGVLVQGLSPTATPEERARVMEQVARLRLRGARSGQATALLLLLAAGCMAVARYV